MKNSTITKFITLIFIVALQGCGGSDSSSNSSDSDNPPTNDDTNVPTLQASAGLNLLAGADISLSQFIDGSGFQVIQQTQSTDSGDYNEQGQFSFDVSSLQDNQWYLLTADGGNEMDADGDGALDAKASNNAGKIHSLARGSWLKAQGGSHISLASELAYQGVRGLISTSINDAQLSEAMDEQSIRIFGNVTKNASDLLAFNPKTDESQLDGFVKNRLANARTFVLEGYSANVAFMPYQDAYPITDDDEVESILSLDESELYSIINADVVVTNMDTLNRVTISGPASAQTHKMAYDDSRNKVYLSPVSDGVLVFDIEGQTYDGVVLDGTDPMKDYSPNDLVYCSANQLTYLVENNLLVAWNPSTNDTSEITLTGGFINMDVNDDCSELYLMTGSEVQVFNIGSSTVTASYSLSDDGLKALSSEDGDELFVVTYDGLEVIDRVGNASNTVFTPNSENLIDITRSHDADLLYAITEESVYVFNTSTRAYESSESEIVDPNNDETTSALYIPSRDALVLSHPTRFVNVYSGRDLTLNTIDIASATTQHILLSNDENTLYINSDNNELFEYTLANNTYRQATLTGSPKNMVEDTQNNQLLIPTDSSGIDFVDQSTLTVSNVNRDEFVGPNERIAIANDQDRFFVYRDNTDDIDVFTTLSRSYDSTIDANCSNSFGNSMDYVESLSTLFYACPNNESFVELDVPGNSSTSYTTNVHGHGIRYDSTDDRLLIGGHTEFGIYTTTGSEVGIHAMEGTIRRIERFRDEAWILSANNRGLFATNLESGTTVEVLDTFVHDIAIQGERIFVATNNDGVLEVDVSDLISN